MQLTPAYPTSQHAAAAAGIVDYFQRQADIEALLLMGSTARGKASPESCLDFLVLVRPEMLAIHRAHLEQDWQAFYASDRTIGEMRQLDRFTHVDLDFIDGYSFQSRMAGSAVLMISSSRSVTSWSTVYLCSSRMNI